MQYANGDGWWASSKSEDQDGGSLLEWAFFDEIIHELEYPTGLLDDDYPEFEDNFYGWLSDHLTTCWILERPVTEDDIIDNEDYTVAVEWVGRQESPGAIECWELDTDKNWPTLGQIESLIPNHVYDGYTWRIS